NNPTSNSNSNSSSNNNNNNNNSSNSNSSNNNSNGSNNNNSSNSSSSAFPKMTNHNGSVGSQANSSNSDKSSNKDNIKVINLTRDSVSDEEVMKRRKEKFGTRSLPFEKSDGDSKDHDAKETEHNSSRANDAGSGSTTNGSDVHDTPKLTKEVLMEDKTVSKDKDKDCPREKKSNMKEHENNELEKDIEQHSMANTDPTPAIPLTDQLFRSITQSRGAGAMDNTRKKHTHVPPATPLTDQIFGAWSKKSVFKTSALGLVPASAPRLRDAMFRLQLQKCQEHNALDSNSCNANEGFLIDILAKKVMSTFHNVNGNCNSIEHSLNEIDESSMLLPPKHVESLALYIDKIVAHNKENID
ncbi:Rab GTPase domain-containing protein, partial [Reticulomyxa filosa]